MVSIGRGGYHEHAERWGRKSAWQTQGGTKTIRVPEQLAEQILELGHKLDRGEIIDSDTKAIDPKPDTLLAENEKLKADILRLESENLAHREKLESVGAIAKAIKTDSTITRGGKDRGSVARALNEMIDRLKAN